MEEMFRCKNCGRVYYCPQCGRAYQSAREAAEILLDQMGLKSIQREHDAGQKHPYECPDCTRDHQCGIGCARPFCCTVCGRPFQSATEADQAVARVTNSTPEREYCGKCKENFRNTVADEIAEVLRRKS